MSLCGVWSGTYLLALCFSRTLSLSLSVCLCHPLSGPLSLSLPLFPVHSKLSVNVCVVCVCAARRGTKRYDQCVRFVCALARSVFRIPRPVLVLLLIILATLHMLLDVPLRMNIRTHEPLALHHYHVALPQLPSSSGSPLVPAPPPHSSPQGSAAHRIRTLPYNSV